MTRETLRLEAGRVPDLARFFAGVKSPVRAACPVALRDPRPESLCFSALLREVLVDTLSAPGGADAS